MKKAFKFLATAACVCMITGCGMTTNQEKAEAPQPERVQVVNPMKTVNSAEEMEQYLDFSVPVLEKEVASYIVLVIDGYPEIGRIRYSDESIFNKKFGSGDISGIYGGTLEKTEETDGVTVSYYNYDTTRYAIWEEDGFTYSLTGGENLEDEVSRLLTK